MTNSKINQKNSSPAGEPNLNIVNEKTYMQTITQLKALGYKNGEKVFIRCFKAKGDPENLAPVSGYLTFNDTDINFVRVFNNDVEKADDLVELNNQGYGIYLVVNPGGHTDKSIISAPTLFFEDDSKTLEQQSAAIKAFETELGQQLSLVVKTKRSLHCYLRLENPLLDLTVWQQYQRRLIQQFDCDSAIQNPSRLMRLAGFNHIAWDHEFFERSYQLCEIVQLNNNTFTTQQLDVLLPTYDLRRWEAANSAVNKPPTDPNLDPWDSRVLAVYTEGYDYNGRKDFITCQCPHHKGQALDSLHINKDNGSIKCHAGCDPKDIYQVLKDMAIEQGHNPELTNYDIEKYQEPEKFNAQKIALKEEIKKYLGINDPIDKIDEKKRIMKSFGLQVGDFNQLCLDFTRLVTQNRKEIKLFTLKETLENSKISEKHLIPGWMAERSSAILTGLPGAGKTKLAIDLAYALTHQTPFLGVTPTRVCKVLLINSDQPLETDTRTYLIDRGFTGDEQIMILNNFDCGSPQNIQMLIDILEDFKPDVTILDTLRAIVCEPLGISENDAIVGKWLREINDIIMKHGTAFWLHHESKSKDNHGVEKASGNTAITSVPSAVWSIKSDPKNPDSLTKHLSIYKSRICATGTHELSIDPETSAFVYKGLLGEDPIKAKERNSLKDPLIKLLKAAKGTLVSLSDIYKGLNGNRSVYTVLKRLVESSVVDFVFKQGVKYYRIPASSVDNSVNEVADSTVDETPIESTDNTVDSETPDTTANELLNDNQPIVAENPFKIGDTVISLDGSNYGTITGFVLKNSKTILIGKFLDTTFEGDINDFELCEIIDNSIV